MAEQDQNPLETIKGVKCFVLDMDGTIYLGDRLFPFTLAFLKGLADKGKEYCFFTNNSSKNAAAYLDKLKKMSIFIPHGRMMTSNQVIIRHILLKYPQKKVYVVGTPFLLEDFEKAGIKLVNDTSADLTVLGFDTSLTYEKLRVCCDIVRAGKPILGVNPDFNCPVEKGFIPDCGAMARLVEASTGVLPEFFGKPSSHTLEYIIEKTGCPEEDLCFVGDRLYTDIAITKNRKCLSVLVLTGETKREETANSPFRPSIIAESVSELLGLL